MVITVELSTLLKAIYFSMCGISKKTYFATFKNTPIPETGSNTNGFRRECFDSITKYMHDSVIHACMTIFCTDLVYVVDGCDRAHEDRS